MATILIIDDQPVNLKMLVGLLKEYDYKLLVAVNGEQALDILAKQQPDIILMDIMMPGMNGFELCRAVKEDIKNVDIPIIFLSALTEEGDKIKGFEAGGVDFISKPFYEKEVLLRINTHLTLLRQKRQLQKEKETLAVTLGSIGDGVITTDTEGRVTFLNKVAEGLTGWSNKEAQGVPSTEVFHLINEKTGDTCASPIQRVLQLGKTIGLENHSALIARDGTVRPIADSGAPIRNRESNIIGTVLVFKDVSNERKVEEELLKIRKLESVGVLAGGIAHDFNNILAAILGNIELLGYRVPAHDAKIEKLLASARKGVKRAVKLTYQLLTFSKGGEPIKDTVTLPELIRDSAGFVLQGSKTFCEYEFAEDLWRVDVDSGQISQVIQNIVINADHSMPEGGRVTISCSNVADPTADVLLNTHEGEFVRIDIKDKGIGIPETILDKIFDPYYSTKKQGSGLGLAICHSIITKHEGHLLVDSSPGKGTIFTIYLPAHLGTASDDQDVRLEMTPAAKTARILVMDDDEMVLEVVQDQLATLGYEPVLVRDGDEAINKYQELRDQGTPVDLMVMDLTIPGGMGGQDAARKLLQIDPQLKIIVASGYSNDPVMANYEQYGFRGAIHKPADLLELSRVISSVLGGG